VSGLEAMMKSTTYAGRIPDHTLTVALALDARMIQELSGRLTLTAKGRAFTALNPERSYELARGQARCLAEALVFDGIYREAAVGLFRRFRRDPFHGTFVLPPAAVPRGDFEVISLLSMMRDCGVLETSAGAFLVTREFLPDISRMRASRRIAPAELEWLMQLRNAQGEAAERWVVEFETRRLQANQCLLEAAAILKVSAWDVAAGYDVASFDGASEALAHDRFIEVKSTLRADPEFFWSSSEFETARDLRTRYWVYLLLRFGSRDQALLAVKDPAGEVEAGRIQLEAASYRATIREGFRHASENRTR